MWLLRFHLIEPRDYNRVDRILAKKDITSQRFSSMLIMKGILLHVLQGKSWRQAAAYIGVPYTALYQFYRSIDNSGCIHELVLSMIERRIALHVQDERHITSDILNGDMIVMESIDFYTK